MRKLNYTSLIHKIKKGGQNSNIRNGLLFTFFSFLNNGINFLLLLILARYLSPEGYGKLNLFNTLYTVLLIIVPLGTTGFVSVSYFKKTRSELQKVISYVFLISGIVSLILLPVIAIGGDFIQNIVGFSYEYQMIVVLICFFQIFSLVNLDILRLEEKPIKYGVYSIGIALLNFLLTFVFIISLKMGWIGRPYGQILTTFVFFLISLFLLINKKLLSLAKIDRSILKEVLSFGVPLIPHQISVWMRQGIDRYIINYFAGAASVGLFSLAFNFGNVILLVGLAFNASNSVFIYKNLANETNETKNKLYKQTCYMSLLFLILTILVFVIACFVLPYIFPKYEDAQPFLFPICFASFFQCVYYLFVNYLFYYKKTTVLMYITTSVSLVHLLFSFLLTRYSVVYTAYISLVSNFLICIFVILYSQKIYPLLKKNE